MSGTAAPLDNPAWEALTSLHATLAEDVGAARRYQRGVSVFAGVERLDVEGWASLAALAGDSGSVVLARAGAIEPPPEWEVDMSIIGHQMVPGPRLDAPAVPEVRELTVADVPAMLELVELTRPGPFFQRTIELGRYIGVIEHGRLVAMAGERMRLPGFTEVSAVCTHPDARGRGLAAALTHDVARSIMARGDQPFLHVAEGNDPARRVYERLGFVVRVPLTFAAVRSVRARAERGG